MRWSAVGVWLVFGLVVSAQDVQKEYERFQGHWRVTRLEENGEAEPESELRQFRLTIRGRTIIVEIDGQRQTTEFAIDPTQTPKHISLTPHYGEDKGKTFRGIYEIDQNSLRICATLLPERPKAFESRKGLLLMVLQRVPESP
jgi:uncharacterized protein (TIGR03067 family)